MRITEKVRTTNVRAEFDRGFIEDIDSDGFFRIYLRARPENYDYSNWTLSELKDLQKALNAFLKRVPKF